MTQLVSDAACPDSFDVPADPTARWTRRSTGSIPVAHRRPWPNPTDLYQAVQDPVCDLLAAHVREPVGGFTGASIDELLDAAVAEPAGFRLLFQHAARERRVDQRRSDLGNGAHDRSDKG